MRSSLVGSPLVKYDAFSIVCQDYFIPWSVQEKSSLRFKDFEAGWHDHH